MTQPPHREGLFLRDPVLITPKAGLATRAEHPGRQQEGVANPVTVLALAENLIPHLQKALGAEATSYRVAQAPLYRAPGVDLLAPGIGAPAAAIAVEKVVASGTRAILFLGYAGGLGARMRAGDLLIVTGGFIDEGTSRHYARAPYEPEADPMLVKRLLTHAPGHPWQGPVWTTDAIYRETPEKARAFRDRGAMGVDMETTAILTLAEYRGVPAAGCHVVTDRLGEEWTPAKGEDVAHAVQLAAQWVAAVARERVGDAPKA